MRIGCNSIDAQSGLVTAFKQSDLDSYARIFVLNPAEVQHLRNTELPMQDGIILFETSKLKYQAMRLNVPVPADWEALGDYEHLKFYELNAVPNDWQFDNNGHWIGAYYSFESDN